MLVLRVLLLFSTLFINCKCANITINKNEPASQNLVKCITATIEKYFTARASFTYVDMNSDDDELLRGIHSTLIAPLILRQPTARLLVKDSGYLITALNVEDFCNGFKDMHRDLKWNPSARFLIVIKSLKEIELKTIFDVLLKQHVINVVLVTGTDAALLYTYNPFDHYGCGKYYKQIESLGACLQTDSNLFSNKLVTGLRNCTLHASVPDRPPYAINPDSGKKRIKIGVEQYVLQMMSEAEEFKVNYTYDFEYNTYTTITPDLKIDGPLEKLYSGEADVMFGSALLVAARTEAFTYISGYLDVYDEIIFLVKRASNVPAWKMMYLVFQPQVWLLLITFTLVYSITLIKLLGVNDAGSVILNLLVNLVGHGCKIPRGQAAKFFFLIWIWFAYLLNSFYQSSLYTCITNPIKDYQIATEKDLIKYNIKPCMTTGTLGYLHSEYNETIVVYTNEPKCNDPTLLLKTLSKSSQLYSLSQKSLYDYHKIEYYNKYGIPYLHSFKTPYLKIILGIYFYKGFPISKRMQAIPFRLFETGIVTKSITDQQYALKIKHKHQAKQFKYMIVIPWYTYAVGCSLATIMFIVEIVYTKYNKV